MDLRWTEEQVMMRRLVREFAKNDVAPEIEAMERTDQFPRDVMKKMGKLGLMGIPIPESYGGSGMDFTSYIIAIHELSKVSATVGLILSVHSSVGSNPILYFGTEEQKKQYLPKLATGDFIGAFALTEPSAGSDAASISTRAVRQGDDYIINGSKMFISNAEAADTFIMFAVTDPGADAVKSGITAFIVERNTPGFFIGKSERKMGMHGSSTVALQFDEARVPAAQRLGEEGDGFKIAMANLNIGRIGIAAQALGIAEGAYEQARDYARGRRQFGRPIGEQEAIGFKLADMATAVEAAKLLVYQAADLVEQGRPCVKEASMAKLFASDTAMKVTTEAIQIFGGYGYTEDYPVERYFRDAKVTQIYEGTSEIQHIVISKQLLK